MAYSDKAVQWPQVNEAEDRYAELSRAFLERDAVRQEGKGFGSSALKVNGRIFAMMSSRGEFVVKLPSRRVAQLVASGQADHYDAGKGRPMKEWLVVPPGSALDWSTLADEALTFVRGD
jgi:hypothetical protein